MERRISGTEAQRILQSWQRNREAFFAHMQATAERANLSDEEANEIVTKAIDAVRAERRAQTHSTAIPSEIEESLRQDQRWRDSSIPSE